MLRQTARARIDKLNSRFAQIMSDLQFELRPFTVAEFGDKSLSPYQRQDDHLADISDPEPDDETEQYLARSKQCVERLSPILADTDVPKPTISFSL